MDKVWTWVAQNPELVSAVMAVVIAQFVAYLKATAWGKANAKAAAVLANAIRRAANQEQTAKDVKAAVAKLDGTAKPTPALPVVLSASVPPSVVDAIADAVNTANPAKDSPSALGILAREAFRGIISVKAGGAMILLCAALCLGGCASNRATFVEDLYDAPTGNLTAHTTYTGGQLVTAGSKLPEGVTELSYQGQGKNPWSLKVGANEKGMEAAGDPAGIINVLMPLVQMITQMQVAMQPGKIATDAAKADTETARLELLMTELETILARNAAKPVGGETK